MKNHQRPGEFDRWPVISNHDLRSDRARANRPFGAAAWNPHDPDNRRICEALIEIRNSERAMAEEQNREWFGLNSRQYAYRLKTRGFLFADRTKLDKKDFERVERILVRARRDNRFGFNWEDVSDGRGLYHVPDAYRDNSQRIETLADIAASQMPHNRMEDQPVVPELAVETNGLYNLIYDLADRYGARSIGLQGQSAVRPRYELARRVAVRWWTHRIRTRVLCVADFDKAGDEILSTLAADTGAHLKDMEIDPDACLQVIRVALTQQQIDDYGIPTTEKDDRLVQEAEALPTDRLREEVEAALRDTLNTKLFDRIAKKKNAELNRLVQQLKELQRQWPRA
jgi:hypothetical protein